VIGGTPGWPARLGFGDVMLRPYRMRDSAAWTETRLANREWLLPWESVAPADYAERNSSAAFSTMLRSLRRQARAGHTMAFCVLWQGRLVGQVTVGNIVRGALNSAYVGYWVDGRYAGRGITPTAVALVADHCFTAAQLHRIEANVRPENAASRRVVEKLGFREEGMRERYLFIDGAYRDHLSFVLTEEEVPEGVLNRWRAAQSAGSSAT
jgi:ribosomal-protein-alanine N-acetyltransferase